MYTIQENVRIVIAALKAYNIRHIVVNPGGTNIPISQAVQDDDFFKCYSVVDERSAMYFAIGLHLQTGEIIATSCTSAQATRNYIPGLTEAFYKHVPILAITTSKLQRYQYQEYMQAPDQCSLPRDAVKHSFDLPPVKDNNTRIQCIQDTTKAILELTHHGGGPVQLNLRIDDIENGKFGDFELPKISKIERYYAWDSWKDVSVKGKRILIVIGEHRPFSESQINAIKSFCESYNAVVYANHISNYHGAYTIYTNLLLSCMSRTYFQHTINPDILITIGGQTGDYGIFTKLRGTTEHWRICEDGEVVDTYNGLRKIFVCPPDFFFNRMKTDNTAIDHSYYEKWHNLEKSMKIDVELPFSNLYIAQHLHNRIPENSYVNFAILNSLRCWNYFNLPESVHCFSNVAAFGIDGCTSTLIGESMNTDERCFIITGDLAFFYDMNSLGIRHIKNNIRILLVNNNSGAEFKLMTSHWKEKMDVSRFISANGHNGNAKGWAENCGFKYLSARTKEEFLKSADTFLEYSDKPILFEAFTLPDDEKQANNILLSSNTIGKVENGLKSVARTLIGDKGLETIKKLLNKE